MPKTATSVSSSRDRPTRGDPTAANEWGGAADIAAAAAGAGTPRKGALSLLMPSFPQTWPSPTSPPRASLRAAMECSLDDEDARHAGTRFRAGATVATHVRLAGLVMNETVALSYFHRGTTANIARMLWGRAVSIAAKSTGASGEASTVGLARKHYLAALDGCQGHMLRHERVLSALGPESLLLTSLRVPALDEGSAATSKSTNLKVRCEEHMQTAILDVARTLCCSGRGAYAAVAGGDAMARASAAAAAAAAGRLIP
ncbi:hypothetical protein MMPV_001686 [Pyropia vietnamensis]